MAFAKQYYSSYKSNNNIDYYCELWVDGYTGGNPSEISLGGGGPVISYETEDENRFSGVLSSQCMLPFMVKGVGTQAFIKLLRTTYQEKQVYLHLYRATSSTYTTTKPLWSGFLVMDLGAGEDVSFPYVQNLTFIDGLSLLKDIDFVQFPAGSPPTTPTDPNPIPYEDRTPGNYAPQNMYWGPAPFTYWIKELLLKIGCATTTQGASIDYGFTTAINWYNGTMTSTSQSSDPLALTEVLASMFHTKEENGVFIPENSYKVLQEILKHWGARITYWKHEFWIVQIPEYIEDETGFIDNPNNINSRQYNKSGTYLGSQDHLGDTYYTRYEQTIGQDQISKITGTKYNYLPIIKRVKANFLSLNSENFYGGFPYGSDPTTGAPSREIFQGSILDPSSSDFLWLSIPLNWVWDMSNSALTNGHVGGWWLSLKFNFYCTQQDSGGNITTYYLQYDSSNGSYYWVLQADWTPLGNEAPKYIVKSRSLTETDYIGFQEELEFKDGSGNNLTLNGLWDFYLDMDDFGSSQSNPGSFYCRFSGYTSSKIQYKPNTPNYTMPDPLNPGTLTNSGKVSWTNSLQDNSLANQPQIQTQLFPSGYNTGGSNMDVQLQFVSPLKGFLQVLSITQNSSVGFSNDTTVDDSTNSEAFSFGNLLWGDTILSTSRGVLRVWNGLIFVKTDPTGKWGRGVLTGTLTSTQILINEFISGQTKVIISPTMRLVVGVENKNQTSTASGGGTADRPRFVNPIGRLRESRQSEPDPEYFFRQGSFHSLYDEWDYEGFEIIRETPTTTIVINELGGLGGAQDNNPIASAKMIGSVTNSLSINSSLASIRSTVPSIGSNVAVNGNFNVATGWTVGTGWSIDTTNKKASFTATGSVSDLTQSVLNQELTYQINFTVVVTAGSLLVKAGSSGTTETITASGDYSIYLDCEGSNLIKFQAGTTFTGSITYITMADQKSLSSLPINAIGTAVFKTNDTFNLINSNSGEVIPLTVTSNQGSTDTTISVTAVPLYDDIGEDSVILINQDDLSEQYQNKTKGTVAGFGIDADGISKGGIEITGWLNSDTMTGAAITNVPTALSVKNYVDGQSGHQETLAQVLSNGNVTGGTNISVNDDDKITFGASSDLEIYHDQINSYIDEAGGGGLYIRANSFLTLQKYTGENMAQFFADSSVRLYYDNSKKLETTSTGIEITGGGVFTGDVTLTTGNHLFFDGGNSGTYIVEDIADRLRFFVGATEFARFTESSSDTIIFFKDTSFSGDITGTTATFTGLVSGITPTVDANLTTKGYVDTQVATIPKGLSYQGTWNASTNTPTIVSSVGTAGYYWIVSVEGTTTIDGVSDWKVGDWIIFSDSGVYQKIDQSEGDTLQTVTTRGSTTTTGATFGGVVSIDAGTENLMLELTSTDAGSYIRFKDGADANRWYTGVNSGNYHIYNNNNVSIFNLDAYNNAVFAGNVTTGASLISTNAIVDNVVAKTSSGNIQFKSNNGTELARITSGGNLGVGESNPILGKLQVAGNIFVNRNGTNGLGANPYFENLLVSGVGTTNVSAIQLGNSFGQDNGTYLRFQVNSNSAGSTPVNSLILNPNGTATFSGNITIPATPVASTDAASKSYVDAQVGASDTLQEVTDNGNITDNSILIKNNGNANLSLSKTDNDQKLELIGGNGGVQMIKSSYDLAFYKGGTEKMRLNSTGLGIGTSSPDSKLEIEDASATQTQTRMFHIDNNPVNNQGSGFMEISSGSNNQSKIQIEQVSSGGFGMFGTYLDSNIINRGLSASVYGNINFITGSSSSPSSIVMTIAGGTQKGQLSLPSYGSGTFTGTETYFLAVTSSGDVVEADSSALPGGPYLPLTGGTLSGDLTIESSLYLTTGSTSTIYLNNNNNNIYGDVNGVVILTANDNLRFKTNGSERMRIASNGSVGINNSSPSSTYKLDVSGSVRSSGNSPSFVLKESDASGQEFSLFGLGGDFYVRDITNSLYPFKIQSATGNVTLSGSLTGTSATFSGDLLVGSGEFISWGTAGQTAIEGSTASNKLNFLISGSSKMWLNSTGLGIGTTTPATKLHAVSGSGSGATGDSGYQIIADSSGIAGIQILSSSTQSGRLVFGDSENNSIGMLKYDHTDNSMSFNANAAEKMRITSSGNVGIGTTSPYAYETTVTKLHIDSGGEEVARFEGESDADGAMGVIRIGTSNDRGLYFEGGRAGSVAYGKIGVTNYLGAKTESIYIKSDGNVGIGTSSPGSLLQISKYTVASQGDQATFGALSSFANSDTDNIFLGLKNGTYPNRGYAFRTVAVGVNSDFTIFEHGQGSGEVFRIKANGNILINSTSDNGNKLQVSGIVNVSDGVYMRGANSAAYNGDGTYILDVGKMVNDKSIRTAGNVLLGGSLTGTTATFSGNITIPATPVASTDAASKSYVDAQVSATDSLQEVTTIGNTTTNSIMIGSSSAPSYPLDIVGFANSTSGFIATNGTVDNRVSWSSGNVGFLGTASNHPIAFNTNLTERARITSGGNLGLGTTSPSEKLEVNGGHIKITNAGNTNLYINANNSGSDATIFFEELDSVKAKIQHDASNNSLLFTDGDYTETMTLKEAKVGIGTTSPDTYMQIEDLSGTNLEVDLQITNTNGSARFGTTSGYSRIWTNNVLKYAVSETVHFWYNNLGTVNMKMDYTGNLLIGSTSDNGAKLQVTASATNDPIIEISNSDNGGVAPSLTINGTNTASSAIIDLNRTSVGRISAIRYLTSGTVNWFSGIYYNGGNTQNNFGIGTDRDISNQK